MKTKQSKIKPIMAGKKNWNNILFTMDNFRPQEIKMTNKVLIEKSSCCLLI